MSLKEDIISLLRKYGIVKSAEPEKEEMISYEVIYEPDTVDTQGEWMSAATLEKACIDFNEVLKDGGVASNLFHVADGDWFTIEDTWIQKEFDVTVEGSGEPIKAGTWIAKIQYHDEDVWSLKKSNHLGGVSVSCWGKLNKDTGELTNLIFEEPEKATEDDKE